MERSFILENLRLFCWICVITTVILNYNSWNVIVATWALTNLFGAISCEIKLREKDN